MLFWQGETSLFFIHFTILLTKHLQRKRGNILPFGRILPLFPVYDHLNPNSFRILSASYISFDVNIRQPSSMYFL